MKLISSEIQQRFAEIGDQSENKNPILIAEFFNPIGSGGFYASEYNPDTNVCFGYITALDEDGWGTFSITELEALKLPLGMKIDRNIQFKEKTFNEFIYKKRFKELNEQIDNTKAQEHDLEH